MPLLTDWELGVPGVMIAVGIAIVMRAHGGDR